MGAAHIGLGNVSSDLGRYDEAINYYKKALEDLEGTDNFEQTSRSYNNLGDTYIMKKDWGQALGHLDRGRFLSRRGLPVEAGGDVKPLEKYLPVSADGIGILFPKLVLLVDILQVHRFGDVHLRHLCTRV